MGKQTGKIGRARMCPINDLYSNFNMFMICLYASFFNTNFADCFMLEVLDSTDRFSCV